VARGGSTKSELSGKEKPERSAEIFKHLKEDEIEQLTLEIANIRTVSPEDKENFIRYVLHRTTLPRVEKRYSRKLWVLKRHWTVSLQVRPFDFVRKADPSQLINFIQNEHPQTIALILSYLKPQQASIVLSALPQDKQADVARRIATMDRTSPEVIKEVERVLEKKLSAIVTEDFTAAGGVQAIVDILNNVDRGTEKYIMETLEVEDTDLAEEIKKRMFVFEDILTLDNRSIQRFLREVDNNQLAIALKGTNDEVKNKIFANMSKRMAEMVKEDMEFMGPVRLKDVEEAQQKIVNVIRKLEDAGEIVISRGGGDDIFLKAVRLISEFPFRSKFLLLQLIIRMLKKLKSLKLTL